MHTCTVSSLEIAICTGQLHCEPPSVVTRILRHTLQCRGDQDTGSWTPALETDCLHLFVVSLKQRLGHSSSGPGKVSWKLLTASSPSDCFFPVLPHIQGRQTNKMHSHHHSKESPSGSCSQQKKCWRFMHEVNPRGSESDLLVEIKPSQRRSKETCCAGVCPQDDTKARVCALRLLFGVGYSEGCLGHTADSG